MENSGLGSGQLNAGQHKFEPDFKVVAENN